MRILTLAMLAFAAISVAEPAKAQTYDSSYPVCLHVYRIGGGDYYECRYTSLAQCNATASGRSAQCLTNPYFANRYDEPSVRYTRHRVY
jgi:Protein of unknown function (DUF3551)